MCPYVELLTTRTIALPFYMLCTRIIITEERKEYIDGLQTGISERIWLKISLDITAHIKSVRNVSLKEKKKHYTLPG
jgi:hypothetical protein